MKNTALRTDLVTLREALSEGLDYVDMHLATAGAQATLPEFDANCERLNLVRDALKLVKFKHGGNASVQAEGQALSASN